MREVELKAHVDDWAIVKEKIESICGSGNIVSKRDQYFHKPGEKHQAFRIRDNNGSMELTSKQTGQNENGENNLEYELSAPIGEYDKALGFFKNLGYEPYFRKYKNGWEWTIDDVHIELLEVNDLGFFLEMEILIPFKSSEEDVSDSQFHLQKLLAKFGISKDQICSKSYRSMILKEDD